MDDLHGCWLWILRLQPDGTAKWLGPCSASGPAEGTGVLDFHYAGGGVRYEGTMENGRVSGFGVMFYANGDRYEGFWRQNIWDGAGIYRFANGDEYDGTFENGALIRGVAVYPDGTRYEGEFKDGMFDGHGVIVFSDTDRYEGSWTKGRPDGLGKGIINGHEYTGTWEGGCFYDGTNIVAAFRNPDKCLPALDSNPLYDQQG